MLGGMAQQIENKIKAAKSSVKKLDKKRYVFKIYRFLVNWSSMLTEVWIHRRITFTKQTGKQYIGANLAAKCPCDIGGGNSEKN